MDKPKQIKDLLPSDPKAITPESSECVSKLPSSHIARFWLLMTAKYDQRWSGRFTDEVMLRVSQEEWGRELAKFTGEQIRAGLDAVTDAYPDWPPSVGEFKALCRIDPGQHGLPTPRAAWAEICRERGQYSHGVILAVLKDPECDLFTWRQSATGYKAFESLYQRYVARALAGEAFPLPELVEDQRNPEITRLQAKAYADIHLGAVKAALAGG